MSTIDLILICLAVAGVLMAIFFDWNTRKIPNLLTFSMILSGLLLNFLNHGVAGGEQSLIGLTCGILLLLLPFAMGGVGGGDVKLLGAIGSLLGPAVIFKIFLASALFGGIFSLIAMARGSAIRKTLSGIKNRIFYFILTKKFPREEKWKESKNGLCIPYAFAIGCGMLAVLLMVKGG